jgi:hypothetical protein
MRIAWELDETDVARVVVFYDEHRHSWFVKNRIRCNLRADKPAVSVETLWEILAQVSRRRQGTSRRFRGN